jgi:hypothetical protein
MDAQRSRRVAHRQIVRLGGVSGSITRNDVFLVAIVGAILRKSTFDRRGSITDTPQTNILISTFTPSGSSMTFEPDKETDRITLGTETYRIIDRPVSLSASGVVIYWSCPVIL